mmetsp:Transcript_47426/g.125808  ORF Transcript_47426/g.125808 Transcript_47426/m.125808 type:complete len:86 (-) Transcript_47426:150-407(-)
MQDTSVVEHCRPRLGQVPARWLQALSKWYDRSQSQELWLHASRMQDMKARAPSQVQYPSKRQLQSLDILAKSIGRDTIPSGAETL